MASMRFRVTLNDKNMADRIAIKALENVESKSGYIAEAIFFYEKNINGSTMTYEEQKIKADDSKISSAFSVESERAENNTEKKIDVNPLALQNLDWFQQE